MTPRMMRGRIRRGEWMGTTSGLCPGYVQANLVILPAQLASAFREFCERNPGPCPLIEQTAPGASAPSSAPDADLRRDVPRYRVYRDGVLEDETCDLRSLWRADLVSFLLGCSFTFEAALGRAGIALRHQEARTVVPMYVTDRACEPAGAFRRPSRRIDAAHIGGARGRSQRHHREISRITRGAGPRWGSRRARDRRSECSRLRRRRRDPAQRSTGVLGVRGDAAGGRGASETRAHGEPCSRAHVSHGFAG